jgi:hypothetical protein
MKRKKKITKKILAIQQSKYASDGRPIIDLCFVDSVGNFEVLPLILDTGADTILLNRVFKMIMI